MKSTTATNPADVREWSSILRLECQANHHGRLLDRFQEWDCSSHKAGEPFEFGRAPSHEKWIADVFIVKPPEGDFIGFDDQIEWLCRRLETNTKLLQSILKDGGQIGVRFSYFGGQNAGCFAPSVEHVGILAKFGVKSSFQFCVDPTQAWWGHPSVHRCPSQS
jgi:hypothetical protein